MCFAIERRTDCVVGCHFVVVRINLLCTVMYCTRRKDVVTEAVIKSGHARRMKYTRNCTCRFVFHVRKSHWQHDVSVIRFAAVNLHKPKVSARS